MRIAILVQLFPPKWLAGTEIATYNIARHLAGRGHDVHVVTSLDQGLLRESIEQGFRLHRLSVPRVQFLGIVLFWLKALLRLRTLRPELVLGQGLSMGVPACVARRLWRRPYVVWGRGMDVYLPWLSKGVVAPLVLSSADTVIALTEDMKAEMQKICSRDVEVIPNGIDVEGFQDLPAKAEIREELGLGADDKIIVFVGTLRPVKGLKYLVEAMNVIRQSDNSARLMLVGDGEERQQLEALVQGRDLEGWVTFLGRVPNESVPRYLAGADVFVLPSLSEGFPNVVLEAMAAGLPVVASRVGGLPEIVEEGENGFLVEGGNPEQIADRVLRLLGDDELRARISATNREKARAYTWESVVDRLEEVYGTVVKARK